MRKNKTKVITITAMMITIAMVLRYLGIMIPIGGVGGMRISFSGFFTKIPAVLFGGIIGGMANGIMDILGCIIKPEGAYIPLLTVTAITGGVLVGVLWKVLKQVSAKTFRIFFRVVTVVMILLVIFTCLGTTLLKDSSYGQFLQALSEKRYQLITIGAGIACLLCVIVCVLDFLLVKKQPKLAEDFMRLLFVLFCANITVTTLNTFVLRLFIPALNNLAFMVFYLPRLIEEIIMTVIQCYGMVFLLSLLRKMKIYGITE
ncbi:ECF transporter S component [Anaerosporobacter faecicola]|uniref:ECF transporter S component n=1 Tax=Anaerosporobacter faecicola TaxID=2718714 RepID=UPI00143AB5C2|nr:ECF transporter S component [Anaerosporobacter faecicola]